MAKKTDLVGYCGIYCGTCPGYTQIPANMAKNLKAELKKGKFDGVADFLAKMPAFAAFKYYKQGVELLDAISKMRCKSCKAGGGSADCKIRICSKEKKSAGCWQCEKITCGKFKALEESGDTTYLKNLRMIRKLGIKGFLKKVEI